MLVAQAAVVLVAQAAVEVGPADVEVEKRRWQLSDSCISSAFL